MSKAKKALLISVSVVLVVILAVVGGLAIYLLLPPERDLKLDNYRYPSEIELNDPSKWALTNYLNFYDVSSMNQLYELGWHGSPHTIRDKEYWCDEMLVFRPSEGALIVRSEEFTADNPHDCETCRENNDHTYDGTGIFTSGIETRGGVDVSGIDRKGFHQAFGFFEAEVTVPTGGGVWSAFWLQANGTTWNRGDSLKDLFNRGKNGSEIDVMESAFRANPSRTGAAIHYNAYSTIYYKSYGTIHDVGYNLYDGEYHKYGLLWTPDEYVIFVDGKAIWATNFGGVSQVEEFLRLTCEITRNEGGGPYGQNIGAFSNDNGEKNDFKIRSVKSYQFAGR